MVNATERKSAGDRWHPRRSDERLFDGGISFPCEIQSRQLPAHAGRIQPALAHSLSMKNEHRSKPLTFGDLIASIYGACGRRRAVGLVRLALNAQLVSFRGGNRFLVDGPKA